MMHYSPTRDLSCLSPTNITYTALYTNLKLLHTSFEITEPSSEVLSSHFCLIILLLNYKA